MCRRRNVAFTCEKNSIRITRSSMLVALKAVDPVIIAVTSRLICIYPDIPDKVVYAQSMASRLQRIERATWLKIFCVCEFGVNFFDAPLHSPHRPWVTQPLNEKPSTTNGQVQQEQVRKRILRRFCQWEKSAGGNANCSHNGKQHKNYPQN